MAAGINSRLYEEIYTRARALLKREGIESFRLGEFVIEGVADGGLWIFHDDDDPLTYARHSLVFSADSSGNITERRLADVKVLKLAVNIMRANMVLDDLASI